MKTIALKCLFTRVAIANPFAGMTPPRVLADATDSSAGGATTAGRLDGPSKDRRDARCSILEHFGARAWRVRT